MITSTPVPVQTLPATSNFGSQSREEFLRSWRGDAPPATIPASGSEHEDFLAIQVRDGSFAGFHHFSKVSEAQDFAQESAADQWVGGIWAVYNAAGELIFRAPSA